MVLIGLEAVSIVSRTSLRASKRQCGMGTAYVWQPTVIANRDLGFVGIDENLGVTSGTTTTIAGDDTVVRPADGLLVDELDGGVGLGLGRKSYKPTHHAILMHPESLVHA